jgi:hypothetical protein
LNPGEELFAEPELPELLADPTIPARSGPGTNYEITTAQWRTLDAFCADCRFRKGCPLRSTAQARGCKFVQLQAVRDAERRAAGLVPMLSLTVRA